MSRQSTSNKMIWYCQYCEKLVFKNQNIMQDIAGYQHSTVLATNLGSQKKNPTNYVYDASRDHVFIF